MKNNKCCKAVWTIESVLAIIVILLSFGCNSTTPDFWMPQDAEYETAEPTKYSHLAPSGVTISKPECSESYMGRIAYIKSQPTPAKLFVMDGNGCNLQEIMSGVSQTYGWSSNGEKLAVICEGARSICILHVGNSKISGKPEILNRLALPEECAGLWVSSVDWSPAADELIIACGKYFEAFHLIKVSLSREGNHHIILSSEEPILRAVWSPNSDRIAVSIPPYIYLMDSAGNNKSQLTEGISPIWSLDGKQIIFIRSANSEFSSRIAIINSDGTMLEWLYLPEKPIDLTCSELRPDCKLALSPDGQHIAFSGSYFPYVEPGINYQIFRLDLVTKEVKILSNDEEGRFYSEPDWSN